VVPLADSETETEVKHGRGYVYGNVSFPDPVTWTLGISYDDYEEDQQHVRQLPFPTEFDVRFTETSVNPKFGVQWNVTDSLTLRAAAFKVMKPALVNNRTLEPTQVAGFNQLFDDINATKSWRYGAGVDWRVTEDLALGGEVTWRDLDEPVLDLGTTAGEVVLEDREEQLHRAYIYWTPLDAVAVRGEFVYDRYEAESGQATAFGNLPERVITYSLPLGVRLFSPSGFFAGLTGTWVSQDVRWNPDPSLNDPQTHGDNDFFLADAAIGFRFPNRRGIFSLQVNNIIDTQFKYQDDSYREFRDEPSTGPYFPERTFLFQATFNF
jgi:hypothetical protein